MQKDKQSQGKKSVNQSVCKDADDLINLSDYKDHHNQRNHKQKVNKTEKLEEIIDLDQIKNKDIKKVENYFQR